MSNGTTPVGTYPPNKYGLHDMAGNVWEWCLDKYDADFYASSPRQDPLSGPATMDWLVNNFLGVKSLRVLRGGSWLHPDHHVRVTHRWWAAPTPANNDFGFRCVKAVTP